MAEMMIKETPKAVMERKGTLQQRVEEDERELEELLKKQEEEIKEPEVKEGDEKESEELSKEEQTFKKRYGDLRRHMAAKEREWENKLKALEEQSKQELQLPASDEDIDAWAEKYPEVSKIIETIAIKKAKEISEETSTKFKELERVTYETQQARNENIIRKEHADFDELRDSDAFHDWAEEQPKWVQDALYVNSDDPRSVIRVIDLYKADKGLTKTARKQSQKDAAKNVSTHSTTKPDPNAGEGQIYESQVAQMSDKEFEARADEIAKAQREGKFVYDISSRNQVGAAQGF